MLLKNKALLDTSCFVRIIQREKGYESILPLVQDAAISIVNLAELVTVMISRGIHSDPRPTILKTIQTIVPFTEEIAFLTGELVRKTEKLGLSLGDRACIATSMIHNIPVYTCDRPWAKLDLDCEIRLIG